MSGGLLGPSGLPIVELGGERSWRVRQIGDIVVAYQWLDLRSHGHYEEKGPEPCMVLYSAFRRMDTGAKVIRQRDAHMYALRNGDPTDMLVRSAWDGAETLGFDRNDRSSVKRLIDIIVEGIPDLIAMPSEQPATLNVARPTQGVERIVRIGGQVVHQEVT